MSATTISVSTVGGTLHDHWDDVAAKCDELREQGFVVLEADSAHNRGLDFMSMKIGPITYNPQQWYAFITYKPRDEWLEDIEHMYPCYRS